MISLSSLLINSSFLFIPSSFKPFIFYLFICLTYLVFYSFKQVRLGSRCLTARLKLTKNKENDMKTKGDKIREIRVEGPKCTLNLPYTCYDCKGKALSSEVASSSQLAVPFLAFHFKQFYAYDCPLFFSLYLYYKDEERVKRGADKSTRRGSNL